MDQADLNPIRGRTEECLAPSENYRNEWNLLLHSLRGGLSNLRNLALSGELKISKFRCVCWSVLLRVISESPVEWAKEKDQQRQKYEKLKEEFAHNPHDHDTTINNDDPLSQSKQSIWNQYFGDQELFAVIKQDVVRTFPGLEFFRKPSIQEAMVFERIIDFLSNGGLEFCLMYTLETNILFYYAREHPYMCYRQGMHEILAPILFVMHCDHQALQHFTEVSTNIDPLLTTVLNPTYLESDAYFIFSRLMSSVESYYRIVNLVPTSEGYFPVQTEPVDDCSSTEIEVIRQLNFIRDKILAKEDLHLHNHLLKLDIPLHIFGIRWLRLLFGREFPLQDLLMLWDAIFADSDRFELPNYILVAMLIRIRDKLLLSDYTTCLAHLMRYPPNMDVNLILRHALYMYMPKKYERPPNAFIYVTVKYEGLPTACNYSHVKNATLPRTRSSNAGLSLSNSGSIRRLSKSRNSFAEERNPPSHNQTTNNDIKELQYSNALNAARLANQTAFHGADARIIDGFRADSPQLLKLELHNAQTIMTITRLKLKKYLTVLRKYKHSEEASQALDGIEELCAFLDVKIPISDTSMSDPVDQALEANEGSQAKIKSPNHKGNSDLKLRYSNFRNGRTVHQIEATTSNCTEGSECLERINGITDEKEFNRPHEIAEAVSCQSGTRYEIPDNGFTQNASHILGAQKCVELKLFKEKQIYENSDDPCGLPRPDPIGIREKENV